MESDPSTDMSVLRYPFDCLRNHGPLGTIRRVLSALPKQLNLEENNNKIIPSLENYLCKTQKFLDSNFDRKFGIDTAGLIPLKNLTIDSPTINEGIWYEPMSIKVFGQILSHLNINPGKYSFVDFGSGKGRVLINAAEHGFGRIIGVEFAKELYETSLINILNYQKHSTIHHNIIVECKDAVQFQIPEGKIVLFFYSPFRGDVMECVITNIRQSYLENPRDMIIIFYGQNSNSINLFEIHGFKLKEIKISSDWRHFTRYRAFISSNAD